MSLRWTLKARGYDLRPSPAPRRQVATRMWQIALYLIFTSYSSVASAQVDFGVELDAITERASLAPTEALERLSRLRDETKTLSADDQIRLHEQFNRANFFAKDYESALRYGKVMEALGKEGKNRNSEISGKLAQVYPNWMMGNIAAAYSLAREAERTPAAQLTTAVRIQALLAVAQLEADERRPTMAMRNLESALILAKSDSLRYAVLAIQTKVFLASDELEDAQRAVDELVSIANRSKFSERVIRAKALEFTVATAAGQLPRADRAMAERVRLIKQLQLSESLGAVLVDYADFKINTRDYGAARTLANEALSLHRVQITEQLAARATLAQAIAKIQMGQVSAGKEDISKLFKSNQARPQLLSYLSQYSAALLEVGAVDTSQQIEVLRQKLESELALARAKKDEESRGTVATLSRENALKEKEASLANGQRNAWLAVAMVLVVGLLALLWRYIRLHAGTRALAETNRRSELALEEATLRQNVLHQQALETQLRILQAQIEPHFLFNTLANLRYLYREDVADGEQMLDHLIGYLRSAMDELRSETSTIGRELELTRHYLSIMGIRMGSKLQYNISCAREAVDVPFPPAMLLTLVENALKHGIPQVSQGRIDIVVSQDEQTVWLSVLDNGPGVSNVKGTGVGLTNIRQRLNATYGETASLQTGPVPSGGFAASIMIPAGPLDLPNNGKQICQLQ
jgi:hypothetical protein